MGTITLKNFRTNADVKINAGLKDGGVLIDWAELTDIKAWLWSDAQKALAGRCDVRVDADDSTKLICEYAATKPQYPGVNRLIVQATSQGVTKTYDKPAFNFVRWTDDQEGTQITIDDPEVDVEIEVQDVSSTILDAVIAAAIAATADAEHAAHLIPNQVLLDCEQATIDANAAAAAAAAAAGRAPYIDEDTGNWFVWDASAGQYVDSGKHAQGETGPTPQITVGDTETGDAGTEAEVIIGGTAAAPVLRFKIPKGDPGVVEASYKHVETLPTASAATMNNIYLVDTETEDVYGVFYTSYDGSAYSWVQLGTTSINLSDYAEKNAVDQLALDQVNFERISSPTLNAYTKKTTIDTTEYSLRNYSIKTNGTYGTSSTYKHCLVPVVPGAAVEVKASSGYMTRFCFVKSTTSPASGAAIDLCVGSSCVELSAGTNKSFIAPADAVAFLFYRGESPYANTPESIATYEAIVPIDNLLTPSASAPLSANQGVVIGEKIDDTNLRLDMKGLTAGTPRDLSVLELLNLYINRTTLKWNTNNSYKHKILPTSAGEKYLITANNSAAASIAFLTSNSATAGADAPIVSGTSVIAIPAGKSIVVEIPSGCAYLYYYCGLVDGETEPNTPASIAIMREDADAFATKTETQYQTAVDVSSAELLYYYVTAAGKWSANGYHRHIVIPVNAGDTYVIVGTKDYTTYLSYLTSKGSVVSGGDVPLVADTEARYWINAGATKKIVVPTGCKYLCFAATMSQAEYNVSHRLRSPFSVTKIEEVKDVVSAIVGQSGSILSLNPESEWKPKMMAAQKRYYTSSDTTEATPLVIVHLSDIHGNWNNVARFTEFCEKYSSFINMRLNTGDTVADDYDDGIDGYASLPNVGKIINIIGNHDSSKYENSVRDWNYYCGLPCYERFIAPFIEGWGVTQPEDAEANGYCYFYKDYADKKIRVVFVDIMAYDDTEDAWLADVLADAIENEYHVVIATHYAGVRKSSESSEKVFDKMPCNYTTLYPLGSNSANLTPYNYSAYKMMIAVDEFMQGGGKFVGYLQGHYHADFIAKCAEFPAQLIFAIGASKAGEFRDYKHTEGTRFQDEFQVVSIDTKNTIVKIFKVGANIDRYGRTKGSVCINYSTGEILGEGMF